MNKPIDLIEIASATIGQGNSAAWRIICDRAPLALRQAAWAERKRLLAEMRAARKTRTQHNAA